MKNIINKVKYHLRLFLFDKYAIPNVINERISKVILKRYLPNNPVIVDCGAHDGSDSVDLAKIFRKGTIHSFEPVENLFSRLKKKAEKFNNIICYQTALADNDGVMDFYISEGISDASSSLLQPLAHLEDHPGTFFKNTVSVSTITLDSWGKKNDILKVDMLWLDMQGYELKMLKASEYLLNTVSVIHTEVSTKETYKEVAQYKEYRSFLELKGFKLVIEAIPNGWDMGNALFIRNKNV